MMKSKLNRAIAHVQLALAQALLDAHMVKRSAQTGATVGLILGPVLCNAQGFIKGFQNMNTLTQQIIGFIVLLGLLGGLGMVLGGLFSAYKKYDNRNDDVSWAKISIQMAAGGLAMALGWVGQGVVETLGGSSSDIGRSVTGR